MIDSFPAPDAREDFIFFGPSVGRDDQPDILSDRLVRSVTEDALCAWIPGHDDALESLADNRIIGRGNDRGKMNRDIER
jgi:hypothetical protein